jgi:hypothetical protein
MSHKEAQKAHKREGLTAADFKNYFVPFVLFVAGFHL